MPDREVRVLFVCLGNICRSPTAEALFRREVDTAKLSARIGIDSAGTGAWHAGEPPDKRAQAEARKRGIDMSSIRARKVRASDYAEFDYILAMDNENHAHLTVNCPAKYRDRIHLFTVFADGFDVEEVPDPYYGGEDGFANVFQLCEAASRGLLDHIRDKHRF